MDCRLLVGKKDSCDEPAYEKSGFRVTVVFPIILIFSLNKLQK
jgi:hypothetical protein